MDDRQPSEHELLKSGESAVGHLVAILGGFVMMIVGVGLGVTMVLLPIGIPIGLVGLLLFLWGIFGRGKNG